MKILFLVVLVAACGSCYGGYDHDHCDICEAEDFSGFGTPASKCGCCPWPCCCKCFVTPGQEKVCKDVLDINWVLDSSGSIGNLDWMVAKQFVNDVGATLKKVGSDQMVSMVTYSNNATIEWCFDGEETSSNAALEAAIEGLELVGGFTNTVEGLEKAIQCMDSASNRPNVPNVCMVMTDGRTTHRLPEIPTMAAQFRERCKTVVVIGVTTLIDTDELNEIAGPDGAVFTVESFDALTGIIDSVQKQVCEGDDVPEEEKCFCCCTPEQFFGGGGAYYYS